MIFFQLYTMPGVRASKFQGDTLGLVLYEHFPHLLPLFFVLPPHWASYINK